MTLLYVALDHDERAANLALAANLAAVDTSGYETGCEFGFKVNLDHALLWGEDYLRAVLDHGRPVFADLKMNNGPRTMSHVLHRLGELGIRHVSIWAHADANLRAAVERLAGDRRPDILAATFYTRWDEHYAREHHAMALPDLISHWAVSAVANGADGVIVPGPLLAATAELRTTRLTPGVRLNATSTTSVQRQVTTPQEAVRAGADMLVVGSPIYSASDPAGALRNHLDAVASVS